MSAELDAKIKGLETAIEVLKKDKTALKSLYDIGKICIDEYIAAGVGAAGITAGNVVLYSAAETACADAIKVRYPADNI